MTGTKLFVDRNVLILLDVSMIFVKLQLVISSFQIGFLINSGPCSHIIHLRTSDKFIGLEHMSAGVFSIEAYRQSLIFEC